MKFLKHLLTIDDPWMRGWLWAICTLSLIQDWYGKEEYIAMVNRTWHDASYSVPLALGVIALCIWSSFQKKETNEKR